MLELGFSQVLVSGNGILDQEPHEPIHHRRRQLCRAVCVAALQRGLHLQPQVHRERTETDGLIRWAGDGVEGARECIDTASSVHLPGLAWPQQNGSVHCGHRSQCTIRQTAPRAGASIGGGLASQVVRSWRPVRSHRRQCCGHRPRRAMPKPQPAARRTPFGRLRFQRGSAVATNSTTSGRPARCQRP